MHTEMGGDGEKPECDFPGACPDCLYCRFHFRIYRHLTIRTRSPALADDLTQDTILQAMRRIDCFAGRGSLVNWLLAIANNLYNRHLANEKRLRQIVERRNENTAALPPQDENDGEELHEAVRELQRELAALPAYLRAPLELTALRGCDYAEAAETLEIEITTLRMRIHRAKKILAKRLYRYKALF